MECAVRDEIIIKGSCYKIHGYEIRAKNLSTVGVQESSKQCQIYYYIL